MKDKRAEIGRNIKKSAKILTKLGNLEAKADFIHEALERIVDDAEKARMSPDDRAYIGYIRAVRVLDGMRIGVQTEIERMAI